MLNVYDLLNLDGRSIEEKVKKAIGRTKEELQGLETERTCMIYSGSLLDSLRREHVICRLVDTNDLGCSYKHQFILVNNGEVHYLIDLTYSQFGDSSFDKLLSDGYLEVDDDKFSKYLKVVTKEEVSKCVSEAFECKIKRR